MSIFAKLKEQQIGSTEEQFKDLFPFLEEEEDVTSN